MPTLYDDLPYPGQVFGQTHPDRLATMAILFGMTPAPVNRCRVLELGCGDAGNLIPMAFTLPGSSFTGIDLASTAIARGRQLVDQLHLSNIRLLQLDLMDFGASFGEFDYIIAHGLYSWVPPQVRERLLDICKANLAPHGVAFISYNAYPGGHIRDTIRRMMQYHIKDAAGIEEKVKRSRELLEFLVEAHPEEDAYHLLLRSELKSFLERSPAHFFHDELGEYNNRFYLYEFVNDLARHGLQYISESLLLSSQSASLPPAALEKMRAFSRDETVAREQYLDFVKLRGFRQSLLCHSEMRIERRLDGSRIKNMMASASATPASAEPDVSSTAPEEFRYPNGGNMSTNHPLAKAAMLHLGRIWPARVLFSDLLLAARSLAGRDSPPSSEPMEADSVWLVGMLLKLYAANFVELHTHTPACSLNVSDRPVASPLVRAQLRSGHCVTSLHQASVEITDERGRLLVSLLDGSRDHAQLLAEMRKQCEGVTSETLESKLQEVARMALLVA